MAEVTKISTLVEKVMEDLKKNDSPRFSKGDFQTLVYAIMQDPNFKVEKFVIKGDEIVKSEYSVNSEMRKFLDKLLKHAGMTKPEERESVIDTFAYGVNDIAWVTDAVDEAMYIYLESGKNLRVFRDKLRQLTLKRVERGNEGEKTVNYKKSVVDKERALLKRKMKASSNN